MNAPNHPWKNGDHRHAGLLFSGGPAPAANAVISAATLGCRKNGIEVTGFLNGFQWLQDFDPQRPDALREGRHWVSLDESLVRFRNQRGICIKTSRANPGKQIKTEMDFADESLTAPLRRVIDGLRHLHVQVLFTIGGDDTLKTANFIHRLGFPVIHIPKTIDNDYHGIAWTFGYWTAVDTAQKAMLNLRADAVANDGYFIVELMGRKAGWITYSAGIGAEADLILASEDVEGELDLEDLSSRVADFMMRREERGRPSGLICIAEGLADCLREDQKPKEVDQHGNVYYGRAELCRRLAERSAALFKERTGRAKKVSNKQVGYETRTGCPISYDAVLGSMLGYGAYRLAEEGRFGHMVSVEANLDIRAVPFTELIDQGDLHTKIRMVPKDADLFALKEVLTDGL